MLDLGSRPSSTVAQQTCSQLRPRSSRCLTSCGFSLNPASTAFQSNALTSGSMEVLDTIFVGLYRIAAKALLRGDGGIHPAVLHHAMRRTEAEIVHMIGNISPPMYDARRNDEHVTDLQLDF